MNNPRTVTRDLHLVHSETQRYDTLVRLAVPEPIADDPHALYLHLRAHPESWEDEAEREQRWTGHGGVHLHQVRRASSQGAPPAAPEPPAREPVVSAYAHHRLQAGRLAYEVVAAVAESLAWAVPGARYAVLSEGPTDGTVELAELLDSDGVEVDHMEDVAARGGPDLPAGLRGRVWGDHGVNGWEIFNGLLSDARGDGAGFPTLPELPDRAAGGLPERCLVLPREEVAPHDQER
ncbi:hypothetical protein ABT354_20005 [Streptomyces sp. NPDC000594]|uniref:hypothetical protein n=1 Tax=Streptomyces sp. NPDC000594 TaxID=3154261 RepID=UPI0033168172